MNSYNLKLGHIIEPEYKAERDAVHIAVAPAIAGEWLRPGERVGLKDGEASHYAEKLIGIVDPFLREPVNKKSRFWLFLDPGTITSLRHDWTHPAFAAVVTGESAADKEDSKQWLQCFAIDNGMTYHAMMNSVPTWDSYCGPDGAGAERIDGVEGFDIPPEFWRHYEIVTGTRPSVYGATSFTCNC